ncbi:MAG: hypothetical protein DHS20C01_00150 [marine bacterium B5-7]|nr:MAG: hypothetical protein DHS20C01_00150 [marine bacterium B5-7]
MNKPSDKHTKARREFLRKSAIVGTGATIAASLPGAVAAAENVTETIKPDENYRLTRHIADYYKTLS